MAKVYGDYNADAGSNPPGISGPQQESRTKWVRQRFDLSKQAAIPITDTPVVGKALKGWAFTGRGQLAGDATMGTTTIAIGNATVPGKYRAAATFTAVNTPTPLTGAVAAGALDPLTADEEIILTLAAASLPAAGKLYVDLEFYVP
jgi:hypothetical protein